MRIASTLWTTLSLAILAHGGALACSTSDPDPDSAAGAAGLAGALVTAGAAGTAAGASGAGASGAGASGAGASNAGSGGASETGAGAGSGGTAAGAGGSSAGSGGASGGTGGSSAGAGNVAGAGGALPFALDSTSFVSKEGCTKASPAQCDKFPKDLWLSSYMQGGNHSPELSWTAGPAGTLSYALVLFDESNGFTHWAVWDIPSTTSKLPASLPNGEGAGGIAGLKQASFFMNKDGYAGPGASAHVYLFRLYALKVATLPASATATDAQGKVRGLLEASQDVLAKADLRGVTP